MSFVWEQYKMTVALRRPVVGFSGLMLPHIDTNVIDIVVSSIV